MTIARAETPAGTPINIPPRIEDAFDMLRREPDKWAIFLDIDGCLLDLAPTPDSIVVPEGLAADIDRLS